MVANGVVYDATDFGIWALDASTGVILWSYHIFRGEESSPIMANGVLYLSSDDSNLYAFHLPNH